MQEAFTEHQLCIQHCSGTGNCRYGETTFFALRVRWLDSITHSIDMSLSKLWKIVKDRGAWRAAVLGAFGMLQPLKETEIHNTYYEMI